jgi:hypothetical protein
MARHNWVVHERSWSIRTGGQPVPVNQTRLAHRNPPRSCQKFALWSRRSIRPLEPDAEGRAKGGATGAVLFSHSLRLSTTRHHATAPRQGDVHKGAARASCRDQPGRQEHRKDVRGDPGAGLRESEEPVPEAARAVVMLTHRKEGIDSAHRTSERGTRVTRTRPRDLPRSSLTAGAQRGKVKPGIWATNI